MRRSVSFALVCVIAFGAALQCAHAAPEAGEAKPEEDEWAAFKELSLTHENFDEEIAKHDMSAVFFYAPWCGHCKHAKPEWVKAKVLLEKDNIPLFVVNADEAENRPLAQRVGLTGFPSIFIFRKSTGLDKPTKYEGSRSAEGFASGIRKYAGPASTFLEQAPEDMMSPAREGYDHTHVSVFAFVEKEGSEEAKAFEAAADALRGDGDFFVTANLAIAKEIHDDLSVKPNTLVLHRHFDGEIAKSDKIGTKEDVLSFVDENYAAPFLAFSDMSSAVVSRVYHKDGKFNVFIHADASKKDEIKEWAQTIGSKASEHVGNTVVFDPKGDESRLKGFFGFADSVEVSVGLVDLQNSKKKFVMEESADLEKTLAFIAKVVAGEVEPTLKSAPIPATQEESVKVVVGKSFEDVVLGSGRNVLFKIYAPWCGHCKAMAPAFKELADKLEEDEEVIIAKMDGTENEIMDDRFDVRGYPALFFMNSEGKVESYNGGRTLDDMLKYIEEHKTPVSEDILKSASSAKEL